MDKPRAQQPIFSAATENAPVFSHKGRTVKKGGLTPEQEAARKPQAQRPAADKDAPKDK